MYLFPSVFVYTHVCLDTDFTQKFIPIRHFAFMSSAEQNTAVAQETKEKRHRKYKH